MISNISDWLPLLITFIAGLFALKQIRSNNITNARLKWLDNFKQLISEFLSECWSLALRQGVMKGLSKQMETEQAPPEVTKHYFEEVGSTGEHLKIIEAKHNLIKVNLNPSEKLHAHFEGILDAYMTLLNDIPGAHKEDSQYSQLVKDITAHSDLLLQISRSIFKLEWEKTKRFYPSKWFYMKFGKGKVILKKTLALRA